jgi:hypothetical protein
MTVTSFQTKFVAQARSNYFARTATNLNKYDRKTDIVQVVGATPTTVPLNFFTASENQVNTFAGQHKQRPKNEPKRFYEARNVYI